MKKHLIILAAGKGERFQSTTPKQFTLIHDKPVFIHTIRAFLDVFPDLVTVIVLDTGWIEYAQNALDQHFPDYSFRLTAGGKTRTESVQKGLALIPAGTLVAIHDAVRPWVSARLINEGFALAEEKGSAIPVVDLTESLREVNSTGNRALNRENYKIVQTPQFFQTDRIKEAYAKAEGIFSDDATVYEKAGFSPDLFHGDPRNIKITYQEDLRRFL